MTTRRRSCRDGSRSRSNGKLPPYPCTNFLYAILCGWSASAPFLIREPIRADTDVSTGAGFDIATKVGVHDLAVTHRSATEDRAAGSS